jgi:hypothetical protein
MGARAEKPEGHERPGFGRPQDASRTVEIDSHAINFGPQHPAAHGVLRLILEMDGESSSAPIRISACCIAAPKS